MTAVWLQQEIRSKEFVHTSSYTYTRISAGDQPPIDTDDASATAPRLRVLRVPEPRVHGGGEPASSRVSTAPAETNSCTALRCPPIAACISGVEPPPPPRAFTSAPCVRRSRMDPS